MAASAVSRDALTAEEFEKSPEPICVLFSIDGSQIKEEKAGKVWIFSSDFLRFTVELRSIIDFEEKKEIIRRKLILDVGTAEPGSWELLYHIRIHLGEKEVDRFNADFMPGLRPISLEFIDSSNLIHIELRTINRICWPLPTFSEGDITLYFSKDPPLRTWRSLLSLVSPYFAENLSDSTLDGLNLGDFSRDDMKELLYQLYPVNWPIWTNFPSLARAAVGFHVPIILYKLNKHLIDYPEISMEKKWGLAKKLELNDALEVLIQNAVISEDWYRQIRAGFNPKTFFSPELYKSVVCPAVLQAAQQQYSKSRLPLKKLVDPWTPPNYLMASSDTIPLLFRGTTFHVNKGILLINGWTGAEKIEYSTAMEYHCAKDDLIPGQVLISLLNSMYPGGPPLEKRYLRAALVLAFFNGWRQAVEQLEQSLLLEPTSSSRSFLLQLTFAMDYQLENMQRALLLRIETNCAEIASELLTVKDFLPDKVREAIGKRLKKDWSKWPNALIKKATTTRQRTVSIEDTEKNLDDILTDKIHPVVF